MSEDFLAKVPSPIDYAKEELERVYADAPDEVKEALREAAEDLAREVAKGLRRGDLDAREMGLIRATLDQAVAVAADDARKALLQGIDRWLRVFVEIVLEWMQRGLIGA